MAPLDEGQIEVGRAAFARNGVLRRVIVSHVDPAFQPAAGIFAIDKGYHGGMLSVGIIGLPNVGKSSLFNALTAGSAGVSNYPFTTIEPNVGMVAVPDARLEDLERLLEPEEATPCFVRFIDVAGLVEGASRGEGLGNRFLGEIRGVEAVAHVVRCFEAPDVTHVFAEIDPLRDLEIIETELMLADLEVLSRATSKRSRDWQTRPRDHESERRRWQHYQSTLEAGKPLGALDLDAEARTELKALGLLTGKPTLFVANVAEDDAAGEAASPEAQYLRRQLADRGTVAEVVDVSAGLEWELAQLEPEERREFMTDLGLTETGLERLVEHCFHLLGLIRFYTIVSGKLRAWEIPRGTHAPEAAGRVHSDMEHGFIRARVASHAELAEHGSFHELHLKGLLRTEGKDYEVADGDVVEFLFSH